MTPHKPLESAPDAADCAASNAAAAFFETDCLGSAHSANVDPIVSPEGALALPAPQPGVDSVPVAMPGFEAIYDTYVDFVWRSLRRLGVSEAAVDDAVQDVFIVVHRRLAEFEARSSLKTWIFGIAIRVAAKHRRSRKPDAEQQDFDVLEAMGAMTPAEASERREARRLLYSLLEQLSDERRHVFILSELEELSAPDISSALGINVNTVYSRLRGARRDFNQALERFHARQRWRSP